MKIPLPRFVVYDVGRNAEPWFYGRNGPIGTNRTELDRRQVFAALVDEHYRSIYRYAFHCLRDHGLAENLCQEVFLKAWRGQSALRDPSRAGAWLFRIARTTTVDALRSRRKLTPVPAGELKERAQATTASGSRVASEDRERVRAALARLPEETRTVVMLRIMEGMPNGRIAGLLGMSEASASRRLYEGLDALRTQLAAGGYGSNEE